MLPDNPLDDFNLSGDEFLKNQAISQLDSLFESSVVETVLKHFNVPKKDGHRWCREKYADTKLVCNCLPELVPQLMQRFTCVKLKFDTKRITTLSYEWLESSLVGKTVEAYGADEEPFWIVTDLPIIPGQVVVAKRSFPLELPFTGYVSSNRFGECYLLCNLRHFLMSPYCDPS